MMRPGVGSALPLASLMLTEVYDGVSERWLGSCLPCTSGNSVEGRRGYLSGCWQRRMVTASIPDKLWILLVKLAHILSR